MNKVWKARLNGPKRVLKSALSDLMVLKEYLITSIYCFAAQPKVQDAINYINRSI